MERTIQDITTYEIGQIFRRTFKTTNFITPNIMRYGLTPSKELLYELSQGWGIEGDKVYGLTTLKFDKTESDKTSRCYHSLDELEEYIKTL